MSARLRRHRPSTAALWRRSGENLDHYRVLLAEHGYPDLVSPARVPLTAITPDTDQPCVAYVRPGMRGIEHPAPHLDAVPPGTPPPSPPPPGPTRPTPTGPPSR